MPNFTWQEYPPRVLTRVTPNAYALRLANAVSDLTPRPEKLWGDGLVALNGHYNKRGYCVGYSLDFGETPSIMVSDFYIVLDYLEKGKQPRQATFPTLARKDPSICLVKYRAYLGNQMYVFIYRRKKE
jgi:hypothetical protein